MNIVFFGEDSFSSAVLISLVSDKHCINAVFCPKYNNQNHARLQMTCKSYNIPFYRVHDINSQRSYLKIKSFNPDLIVVCHFEKILKKNIIALPKYGCINLHPSLLPKYRGLAPQHWPIINGDRKTGVSVHFIDEQIDTGNIIVQIPISIEENMYVAELQRKFLETYKHIMRDAVRMLSDKDLQTIKQNKNGGSYYGKLQLNDCTIRLDKGYLQSYNLIRGVSKPYFGARLNGYIIWKANIPNKAQRQLIYEKYKKSGFYVDENLGPIIKFDDGSLIISKYDKI